MTSEQARNQRIADRISTLPKITPYEPEGTPLRAIKEALKEAIQYGANSGKKKSAAAETRIAKAVSEALGIDAKHVKEFLDNIY